MIKTASNTVLCNEKCPGTPLASWPGLGIGGKDLCGVCGVELI